MDTERIKNHFYQLEILKCCMQVFVEDVRIAHSEKVWLMKVLEGSEIKNGQYLIPKNSLEKRFFTESSAWKSCPLLGQAVSLDLAVKFPYKIEISDVAHIYNCTTHISEPLQGMVAFSPEKVSFRLDPL